MEDDKIIKAIEHGGEDRDNALKFLFLNEDLRNSVFGILHKYGVQFQDREDIFQDALIAFDRNVQEQKFIGESSISTYIVSISRYIWFNMKKKLSKIELTDNEKTNENTFDDSTPESIYFQNESLIFNKEVKKILWQLLSQLDERCQQALRMWSEGRSMEEIKNALGFKQSQGANNKTFRCRERLRKMIMNNPALVNLLKSRI